MPTYVYQSVEDPTDVVELSFKISEYPQEVELDGTIYRLAPHKALTARMPNQWSLWHGQVGKMPRTSGVS